MKKIIYLLVTLFTILGHQAHSQQQQIGIVTGSAIGNVGDIVNIPVNVILPQGSQLFESCQGAIISTDPSMAIIVGATSNFVTTVIVNNGTCNFLNSSGFINLPANGVLLTLQVQIVGNGCSDFALTEFVGEPSSSVVEFVVDGITYDDLATDFNVNEGTVCGDCDLFINNFRVFPDNQTTTPHYTNPSGNSSTNYEDFTSTCFPHTDAPMFILNASQSNVYMALYLDNNNDGIFEIPVYSAYQSGSSFSVQFPPMGLNYNAGIRVIVSNAPITDPTAIPVCGEVEDYVACGYCSCDISNLTLGPIDYTVNPGDCSTTKVNIPPVLGCDNVEVSHSFHYEVYLAGSLLYEETTTLDGFIFPFTIGDSYTIVITYTIVDDSGCTQQITLSEDYTHEGCNCSCDISNLTLGPIDYTVNPGDCSTTIVNIPPVLGCDNVEVSHSFHYEVYLAGSLLYEETTTLDGFIFPFTIGDSYTIVITYTIVDDSGCTQQITLSEDYTHAGCDCACDINALVLGTPTVTPGPGNCSCFQISIPPVTGCSSVMLSESYKFKIQSANGTLYEINTPNTSINYCFPAPGQYSILVRYTIIDNTGCEQVIQVIINYNFTGCGCQLLGPPTFLDCQPGINPKATFHTLFWTPVLGASSYEIEFTYNDPLCCKSSTAPYTVIVPKTGTSMNVPNGTCYSWRVRSVCANGTKSAWSSKDCSCGVVNDEMVVDTQNGGDGGKSLIESDYLFEDGQLQLQAVPNPATNHVDITLTGLSSEFTLIQPEIIIYDMTGKVIYRSEMTLDEVKRVDLSSFKSGVYFMKAVDNDTILSVEKLVIQ